MPPTTTRAVEVFVAAVEAGNFTRAAVQLGLTPAAVSRAIARHEAALGVRLFRRTTRTMHLTDDGRAYVERCRQALALLAEAERELTRRRGAPRGLVRLSAPTTYGHARVVPVVARVRARHPEIEVELNISNRNVDFVAEGYDLAVRMGEPADSELVAHKLMDATLGVLASPGYLEARGRPRRLEDLERHALIGFVRPSSGRVMPWIFRRADGSHVSVNPDGALRCTDDFVACVALARAGAGLVQAYHFLVADDLARGHLVEVLPGFAGRTRPFHLLQPPRRELTPAVRVVADALIADASAAG